MSTKCTVIYKNNHKDIWYHFYFDYKDGRYHLDYKDIKSYNLFLKRIGKILEQCPLSDSGIYMLSMKKGVKSKVYKNKECELLICQSKKKKKK